VRALLEYAIKAGVLLLAAYFGSLFADNILEMRRLDVLCRRAQAEVEALRAQNQALRAQAHALQHDPFYIELTMRRKLRWVRPGELRLDGGIRTFPVCNGVQLARANGAFQPAPSRSFTLPRRPPHYAAARKNETTEGTAVP